MCFCVVVFFLQSRTLYGGLYILYYQNNFLVNIISTSSIKHLKYMQEVPHSHNFTSKLSRTSLRSSCVPLLPVLFSYQHVSWQFQPMLTSFLTGKSEHNLVLITFTELLECSGPCRVKYRNGSEK